MELRTLARYPFLKESARMSGGPQTALEQSAIQDPLMRARRRALNSLT